MLKLALLGAGGPVSAHAFEAVSRRHRVVLVIEAMPRRSPPRRAWHQVRDLLRGYGRTRTPLAKSAAAAGAAYRRAGRRNDPDVARDLRRVAPDLIAIAAYPWILPPSVYSLPRLGAINLHTSLLPRHRGPMPLYWVYRVDDRRAGVTVHWVSEGADTGDILMQDGFALERGCAIGQVHERCAQLGAELLAASLDAIEAGSARRIPQDEHLATAAPVVRAGSPIVQLAEWDVERVWHVMAGLFPLFRQPLKDEAGAPFTYGGVTGFDRVAHERRPGELERRNGTATLYCRDGIVHLHDPAGT